MSIRPANRGRCAALLLVLALSMGGAGLPSAQEAPAQPPLTPAAPGAETQPAPTPAIQKTDPADVRLARAVDSIEPLRIKIDQIEATLRRDELDDAALVENRAAIDPVRDQLRETIASLEKLLSEADARKKQIGEPPAAGAPPEDASLAAERSRLQEQRATMDGAMKQARLQMLRAEELSERITERRRAQFNRELFGRTSSALSPAFWAEAARVTPDALRGLMLLGQGWIGYVSANASTSTIVGALLTLLAFAVVVVAFLRWLDRLARTPRQLGTRFAKSVLALLVLLRITLTAPAVVVAAVLIIDAFGLIPERLMRIGFGLALAVGFATFGRGVATSLFAPHDSVRRLVDVKDETARLISSHLAGAAQVLGVVVLLTILQRAIVAPVSLTVATSAIFSAITATILGSFLFRIGRSDVADQDVGSSGWLRAAGWLLVIAITVTLLTGYISFAAFLAGRFLVALGVVGALYIVLVFTDALFSDVLTASTPRGRAVANFFGLNPRSIELVGTLLSAVVRLLLVLVALLPLLGPWGVFATDFFGIVRDATFGVRFGEVTISLGTVFYSIVIILVGTLVTRAVQGWLNTNFLPRTSLDQSLQNSISTIFGYIGVISTLAVAMAYLGVDFQKITLVAGALSIGIGFGLQSVVSNFVSGLILLAERPIRVGDVINVKGEEGRVRRIHVRATEIETGDRASVIIPNSELITQVVKNRTHTDTFARVSVPIGVAYDSDANKVRQILLEIAKAHPHVMQSPAPSVLLTGFGESALNFELGWVVRNLGDGGGIKSDICFAILERFREEGIVIPYPQRNIRIERSGVEEPEPAVPAAAKKPKGK